MKKILLLVTVLSLVSCGEQGSRGRSGGSGLPPQQASDDGFESLETSPGKILNNLRKLDTQVTRAKVEKRLKSILEKDDKIEDFFLIDKVTSNFKLFSSLENKILKRSEFLFNFGEKESELPAYHYSSTSELSGLKIALDPKFTGGDLAKEIEKRYVRIVGDNQKIEFAEAAINYYVAELLKYKLEQQGATVLITRSNRKDHIYREDFNTYRYTSNHYQRDVDKFVRRNYKLSEQDEKKAALLSAEKDEVYRDFYRPLVEATRVQMINEFSPNLTLRIGLRLNGKFENNNTDPVNQNVSAVIIPGGYKREDFGTASDRVYFLRHLIPPVLDYSKGIAESILKSLESLNGASLAVSSKLDKLDPLVTDFKSVTKMTENDGNISESIIGGLFAQMHPYFKFIENPVVEVRAVTQDDEAEAVKLKDGFMEVSILSHDYSQVPENNRLMEIANSYFEGIMNYYVSDSSK